MEEVGKHCMTFYIRANRCGCALTTSLRPEVEERNLGGIEFELNSILVEKWKGGIPSCNPKAEAN